MLDFWNGKKTYIIAFVTATLALATAIFPEFVLPDWVLMVLAAGGVTTMRAAIK